MRARKIDGNHTAVVDALEKAGCTVQSMAAIGCGCPDLLVGLGRMNYVLEVKDGSNVPSKRRLTPDQVEWVRLWRGTVSVVETIDQALAAVGLK